MTASRSEPPVASRSGSPVASRSESLVASRSERAGELAYTAGWRVVRAVPEPVARTAFRLGADVAARRGSHVVLRRNLGRVLDVPAEQVPTALVRDSLRSYARYWREAFRLPVVDRASVLARVQVQGFEHVRAAVDDGRGALLVLPHSGNWDVAGLWLVEQVGQFTTVAERLRPESLYRRFVEYREGLGFEILPLTGGESPVRGMIRRLRSGGVVCLVGDRDLSRRGVEVSFFGETARMPPGPATVARSTGAALLPVHCWFTPDGWAMRVHPPVEVGPDPVAGVAVATQAVADRFADGIAAHPADWHMLQPLWTADLPARVEPA